MELAIIWNCPQPSTPRTFIRRSLPVVRSLVTLELQCENCTITYMRLMLRQPFWNVQPHGRTPGNFSGDNLGRRGELKPHGPAVNTPVVVKAHWLRRRQQWRTGIRVVQMHYSVCVTSLQSRFRPHVYGDFVAAVAMSRCVRCAARFCRCVCVCVDTDNHFLLRRRRLKTVDIFLNLYS